MYLSLLLACVTACACEDGIGTGFCSYAFISDLREEFYELCPGDEFEYNGFRVNAVFKELAYLELIPIIKYALDPADYRQLFDKSDADQLNEIQSNYHQLLLELFGKEYLNGPLYKEKLMCQKITSLQTNLTSFRGKGKNLLGETILGVHEQRMEKAKNFSLILDDYKNDGPEHPGKRTLGAAIRQLSSLKARIDDANTTMVFSADEIANIFKKRVYKFDRFKPINTSKTPKYWKYYYGKLHWDLDIPMQQHHSKWVNKTRPCLPARELPKFYQLKGKLDH